MRQIPQHTFPLFLLQEVSNDNAMSNASNLVTWEGLLDEHVANQANANKIIGMEDDDDDEEQISDNEDMGASPAGEPFLNVGTTTGGGVSKYYFDRIYLVQE